MIRHGDAAGFGIALQQLHAHDGGGAERRADELGRVLAPADDVDLFTAQLLDDVGHALAAGADARAHGVHVFILAPDGHFRAGAGLAADGLDLDGAVEDLRHLHLEHALDKAGMRAADHHARAALGLHNIHNIYLDMLALAQLLTGDLLVAGQRGHAALAQLQRHNALDRFDVGDDGGDDLMGLALHLGVHLAALGLLEALADDVLSRLRGDAPEVLCLERDGVFIARLAAFLFLLGLLQRDLGSGVLHFLDDGLNDDGHVFILDLVVLLHGDHDGVFDFFQQVIGGQAAFLFQHGQCFKKFCVHFFQSSILYNIYIHPMRQNRSSSSHNLK